MAAHHRHNKPVKSCRFALAALYNGEIVGVAIVGRPVARILDDGMTAEVNRLCVSETAPRNTCSFLYGTCRRVWQTMGGLRLITYTLASESGASLRGAGWRRAAELPPRRKGAWGSSTRSRQWDDIYSQPKIRWEI